jgi:hypothetical protein
MDFLEHEMRVLSFVDNRFGYVDFLMAPVDQESGVFDNGFAVLDVDDVPVFQIDDIGSMFRDAVHVRREEEAAVFAFGKNERASEFDSHHFRWILVVDEYDGIGAFQPGHEFFHPFEEGFALDGREEFRGDFRVGVPVKGRILDVFEDFPVIFDDAVMDEEQRFLLVGVRMGIGQVDDAVGSPARVADSARVMLVFRLGILNEARELRYFADGFVDVDAVCSVYRDSRRIVSSVFQVLQSFENDFFRSRFGTDVSEYSAHRYRFLVVNRLYDTSGR